MQSRKVWITPFCVLLFSHLAGAQTPVIVNPSFETPIVEEGNHSTGAPGWGWAGAYLCINAVIHPGGPSSREPWPTTPPVGIHGSNFCKLFATDNGGTGVLYQDTAIKYQVGKTYTLTASFGLQMTDGTLAPGCIIFFDNSGLAPLKWTTILAENLTPGEFKDQSVTFTPNGSESPGDGSAGIPGDILIGFWLPPAPAHTYLDVDDVRLKITDAPHSAPSAPSAASPSPSPSPAQPNYFGTHF